MNNVYPSRRRLLAAAGIGSLAWAAGARVPAAASPVPSGDTARPSNAATARTPVRVVSAEVVKRVSLGTAVGAFASQDWVLMMRHERTVPGVGDPPQFRLDDCSTQRNLSEEGRERARRAGLLMQQAGLKFSRVRAGRWCRVEETARLAFGEFDLWPALDSFFGRSEQAPNQRSEVLRWIADNPATGNVMLVTHQVNITGLLEVYPEQGEVIAARRESGLLRARMRFVPADALS